MNDDVTISRERYKELLKSEDILCALENMGVDNWCGYDEAMRELREEDEE